jgi:hypothetical protein
VGALSTEYYSSIPRFHVIFVPAVEATSLLGIADVCHELAHILSMQAAATLLGTFPTELATYFQTEKARVATGQRPPAYDGLYDIAVLEWARRWTLEFVCDMVATFVLGAAYAWQHMRLCVGGRNEAFTPNLGEVASHPADAARMRGILAILRRMGAGADADRIEQMWDDYLVVSGATAPAEFDLCYPPTLIESLAVNVQAGCATLGIRPFTAASDPAVDTVALLQAAWARFHADPKTYRVWEEQQLNDLWGRLGL